MVQWYFGENGQQVGPVTELDLIALIASGRIGPMTLLWREGMPTWVTLAQLNSQGGIYPGQVPQFMGYNMMTPTISGFATASLVCGIVGLVTCGMLGFLGFPAVVCGHIAMHQISKSLNMVAGRGMAITGLVLGYLCLVIFLSTVGMMIFDMVNHP